MPTARQTASHRVNILARHHGPDHPLTVEARRDLEVLRLADHVDRVIDDPATLARAAHIFRAALARVPGADLDGVGS